MLLCLDQCATRLRQIVALEHKTLNSHAMVYTCIYNTTCTYTCIHIILYVHNIYLVLSLFELDFLGVHGGNLPKGGHSHSPTGPQHGGIPCSSAEAKTLPTSTTSAPPPQVSRIEKQSHDSQVDSWEDIDDTAPSQAPPTVSCPSSRSLTPSQNTTETDSKTDSRLSNASSSRQSSAKSQEPTLTTKEALSSSASASSTPDIAKIERKQPSPNLSDKGPSSASRSEGGTSKGSKHYQAPPPKDENTKENINIVFIGHVGMFLALY